MDNTRRGVDFFRKTLAALVRFTWLIKFDANHQNRAKRRFAAWETHHRGFHGNGRQLPRDYEAKQKRRRKISEASRRYNRRYEK